MPKKNPKRPCGGRTKRANYKTVVIRVPLPLKTDVEGLISAFHEENDRYMALPIVGSWWEVLGVSPGASADEVKQAYRVLARLYHPDRNKRRDAEARFTALNEAYRTFQASNIAILSRSQMGF